MRQPDAGADPLRRGVGRVGDRHNGRSPCRRRTPGQLRPPPWRSPAPGVRVEVPADLRIAGWLKGDRSGRRNGLQQQRVPPGSRPPSLHSPDPMDGVVHGAPRVDPFGGLGWIGHHPRRVADEPLHIPARIQVKDKTGVRQAPTGAAAAGRSQGSASPHPASRSSWRVRLPGPAALLAAGLGVGVAGGGGGGGGAGNAPVGNSGATSSM